MINPPLDELRTTAQIRNIRDHQNKSKEDLIKALREQEPDTKKELERRLETKPKTKPKPEPETKIEVKVNKNKLEKNKKKFDELRHKFSKTEINECRKAFYDVKSRKYFSISEIKKINKNLNKFKKSLKFKKFHGNIDSADYDDLDNYDYNYDFADDDEYRKIGSIRTLFKEIDRDYYKRIRTDDGFAGRKHSYMEYKSKGDRY